MMLEQSAAEHDKLQRSGVNSHRAPSRRSSTSLAAARFTNIFIETFKFEFAKVSGCLVLHGITNS